ncbi:putative protein serine/threonine kinase [Cavenderia fasciculata]|uniref:non-specific serine/threonine protein kinase n=1 Tax=Cavenderia fasciculata TaxID=261658 RepID=F4PI71_CACFS|nr:putative protein serine/threonine kinase [Cavenderia fasciculata]EGG25354.1 putative protein serine/threonine kinase [Cavenderia fasciculata]|eukprot:XP_004363205.1 putative protein serine/threonine kinase [Cavenderia fasciculata]
MLYTDFTWGQQYGFFKEPHTHSTTSTPHRHRGGDDEKKDNNNNNTNGKEEGSRDERQKSLQPSRQRSEEDLKKKRPTALELEQKALAESKAAAAEKKEGGEGEGEGGEEGETIEKIHSNGNMFYEKIFRDPVSKQPIESFGKAHYPKVQIVDLGNACWIEKHFTDDIQTRQYRSPEAIVRAKWSTPVDIWSAACMAFELATGDHLFKPKSGKNFDKSDDHLALMIELLGRLPKSVTHYGIKSKTYFNHKGELRNISKLSDQWPLFNVFTEKYKFTQEEAKQFESFLLPMLNYNTEKRATAKECINHPFLKDVPPFI